MTEVLKRWFEVRETLMKSISVCPYTWKLQENIFEWIILLIAIFSGKETLDSAAITQLLFFGKFYQKIAYKIAQWETTTRKNYVQVCVFLDKSLY